MTKRNLYLKTTPVEEALDKYLSAIDDSTANDDSTAIALGIQEISTYDALGRITAEAIFAKCSSPMFNAAAMDGVAVVAAKTKYATEREPLLLTLGEDYKIVDTGDPIKSPYDAVIMAEDVIEVDDEHIKITESVPGWQHVRPVGEDIVAGEMILPSNHQIRAVDIGVLLAGGILEIPVLARPTMSIIPTGTEIIKPYDNPKEGDIIDSNSGMFAAMAREQGCMPKIYDIVSDVYEQIREAVKDAVKHSDIVVVNAGSSAGTEDYTSSVLGELGEVIIHGVAMKPGKPVILAVVEGTPVIGLPGYPVSAYLAFDTFVTPVINKMLKASSKSKNVVKATIAKRLISSLKHREYVRVKVGYVGGKLVASPLARGAGAAMSLVKADGFCIIPQNSEGVEAGEEVDIVLCKGPEEIENTLVSIGSHDMALDIIGDIMADKYPGMRFTSTHVGSMAGLMALKRHETTVAPTHLLDMETGQYNVAYLKQIFDGEEMALIKGLDRIQGIMVKKGNPLGIKGIEDLAGVRYVNRQRGAGTRVLLDYKLKEVGISPSQIDGYDKEAATHMAVAAAVASEDIDAGMGIKPAAEAMGLDFIEVGIEEYDFAIRKADLENPQVKALIDVLRSDVFHQRLDEIDGYSYHQAGKVVEI